MHGTLPAQSYNVNRLNSNEHQEYRHIGNKHEQYFARVDVAAQKQANPVFVRGRNGQNKEKTDGNPSKRGGIAVLPQGSSCLRAICDSAEGWV